MTKISDFPYPIYDLTKSSKPYLWPDPYIKTPFQTNNNNKVYLNCKFYLNYKLTENKLKIHTVAGHPK